MIYIRNIRLAQGLSQVELAKLLHVTPNAISQWETGVRNPSLQKVREMAEILHCTTDEILKGDMYLCEKKT